MVPAPVLAQAWCGGSRQASLARLLALCEIEPMTGRGPQPIRRSLDLVIGIGQPFRKRLQSSGLDNTSTSSWDVAETRMTHVDRRMLMPRTSGLSSAKRDEAPQRIVGRHAHGHTISRHDPDVEPAHAPAQLREHFVAGIAFHSVEPAAMDGNDDTVQIDQIVLAQPFRLLPDRGSRVPRAATRRARVDDADVRHRAANRSTAKGRRYPQAFDAPGVAPLRVAP